MKEQLMRYSSYTYDAYVLDVQHTLAYFAHFRMDILYWLQSWIDKCV